MTVYMRQFVWLVRAEQIEVYSYTRGCSGVAYPFE